MTVAHRTPGMSTWAHPLPPSLPQTPRQVRTNLPGSGKVGENPWIISNGNGSRQGSWKTPVRIGWIFFKKKCCIYRKVDLAFFGGGQDDLRGQLSYSSFEVGMRSRSRSRNCFATKRYPASPLKKVARQRYLILKGCLFTIGNNSIPGIQVYLTKQDYYQV